MPSVIGEVALDLIKDLVLDAIKKGIDYGAENVFVRRRIENRVEDAVAIVVEPLFPFLTHEHVSDAQQALLVETCVSELRPFAAEPEKLFRGSLDGHKIFNLAYSSGLPQAIRHERLENVYELVFPRIASLLCELPLGVQQWQREGWRESYRRLDELASSLKQVFEKIDTLTKEVSALSPPAEADPLLSRARTLGAQKIAIQLDITGLRADRPLSCSFDALFVYPSLVPEQESIANPARVRGRNALDTPEKSFATLLAPEARAIVIGSPGGGKSTWTRWLHRECLGNAWTGLAIRLELRSLSKEKLPPVQEIVRQAVGVHMAEELDATRVRRWLDAGQLSFLFDGLDEVVPSRRGEVCEWIQSLASLAVACPIIVTSRPLTTDHLKELSWKRFQMEPFDHARVVRYIDRWYRYSQLLTESEQHVDAEQLARIWKLDPTLGPLTGNPLLLSTLLVVHHLDGKLPSGRAELYRRYVDGMLGGWDDRRKVDAAHVSLTTEQKRRMLRGVALKMHMAGQDQVDEADMLFMLQAILGGMRIDLPTDEVLSTICERSGLLVGPGVYSFVHKSVGEYLVAETVVEGEYRDEAGNHVDRFRLFQNRHEDRWNTVLFLWAGRAPQRELEDFVLACLNQEGWAELSIALGLLLDQFDRLPTESKRVAVTKAGDIDFPPNGRSRYYWGAPSGLYVDISINNPPTRGLRPSSLNGLLEQLVAQGELAWPQQGVAPTSALGALVWLAYMNSKDWRKHFLDWMTVLPVSDDQSRWRIFALSLLLGMPSSYDEVAATGACVTAAEERWPELKGISPFLLMSFMVLGEPYYASARSLPLLLALAEKDVNAEWLAKSTRFQTTSRSSSFDLLRETFEWTQKEATAESRAVALVLTQLMDRRSSIKSTATRKRKKVRT